ncbi:MAG TPA: pseudouridine synthase [Isosphaeraceae bacterium]|nr:pseudouridine synthase [Isosphaeraceae bacterium]
MAKHRPSRPKGHSSDGPSSGHKRRSGSGPGPRRRSAGAARARKDLAQPQTDSQRRGPERPPAEPSASRAEPGKPERLQKVLAQAGLGSRRGCEELVLQGRVTVDGQVIRQLGTRVDPARARIAVDGEPIRLEPVVYFAVNKPKGYVSTNFDPAGRPRVVDLLPEIPERVYTVGRLDEDSTGLMILTNDGELANRLAHPRFGVAKTYRAQVAGLPGPETIAKLTEGIWLAEGKVRVQRARVIGHHGQATWLELVLAEGKKREIRRMLAKLGHKVMALNRVAIGPITLKGLAVGECRRLARHEVDLLQKVAAGIAVSAPRFADAEPAHGPRRDAQGARPRPGQPDRRARAQSTGPNRPPRRPDSSRRPTRHTGPLPARAQQGRTPTAPPHGAPAARPPSGRTVEAGTPAAKRTSPPGRTKRPPGGLKHPRPAAPAPAPPEEAVPRRRIIGPGRLRSTPDPGRTPAGPPGRKRPAPRKPRPPRGALGPGPRPAPRTENPEDSHS